MTGEPGVGGHGRIEEPVGKSPEWVKCLEHMETKTEHETKQQTKDGEKKNKQTKNSLKLQILAQLNDVNLLSPTEM